MSHGGRVQIGIEGTLAAGIGANGSLTYLFGLDKLHMCPLRQGVEPRSACTNKPRLLYGLRGVFCAMLEVDVCATRTHIAARSVSSHTGSSPARSKSIKLTFLAFAL